MGIMHIYLYNKKYNDKRLWEAAQINTRSSFTKQSDIKNTNKFKHSTLYIDRNCKMPFFKGIDSF